MYCVWDEYFSFLIAVEISVTSQPGLSTLAAIDVNSERLKTQESKLEPQCEIYFITLHYVAQQVGIVLFDVVMSLLLNVQVEECAHYQGPFY